jgi:dipeptidyl aminopeptidase/acylaminoacyl peptidase
MTLASGSRPRAPATGDVVAFKVDTPPGGRADSFALSPDGRQLAFTAPDKDGQERLWLRPLASADTRMLPGTEGAMSPFWSPDSRRIAFLTVSELKSIDLAGEAAQTISKTSGVALGGTWNDQQVILFAQSGRGILRVRAGGGEPQAVTALRGDALHVAPAFMPDGRHFVYVAVSPEVGVGRLIWRALDTSEEHVVRTMYSKAFYSPTGYLLFRLGGPIMAQPFDAARGTILGDPTQVAPDTVQSGVLTALAVSSTGVLAHRAGPSAVAQLSWLDRNGKTLTTVGTPANYWNPSVDAISERVVANTVGASDVWLLDGQRGTTSRLTFDPANDSDAIFSPDGRWVAFYSARQPPGIYRKAISGMGADEMISATGGGAYPRDWSPDGRFLLYDAVVPTGNSVRPVAIELTGLC